MRHQLDQRSRSRFPRAFLDLALALLCGRHARTPARRFLTSLYQHGRHLFENLSVYFSPNTHLLGEAVALHALGTLFPTFPKPKCGASAAPKSSKPQLAFQVKPDGSHFEQSTYYHVYALDFFILYYLLAGKPAHLEPTLLCMAEYLHWLLGPARRISYFGDDDGGRLFHPQGKRDEFGRATLATCGLLFNREAWIGNREDLAQQAAWWLGSSALSHARPASNPPIGAKNFPDAGALFYNPKTSISSSTPALLAGPVPATVTPILSASPSGITTNPS